MCLQRSTWVGLGRWSLMALVMVTVIGVARAQQMYNQDYINGNVTGQLSALSERVNKIETLINYLITLVMGSVAVQIIGLALRKTGIGVAPEHRDATTRSRREDPHDDLPRPRDRDRDRHRGSVD